MKVAIVGAGIAGLIAAHTLAKSGFKVVIYEKESYAGGHARTVHYEGTALDLGFMVFNRVTYPNMVAFFEENGVEMEVSDMSFSVSLDEGTGCEWGSRGLSGLFAQKHNLLNPYFLQMIREMVKFNYDVDGYLKKVEEKDKKIDVNETLGSFLQRHGYSKKFRDCYLIPVCASIWSCSSDQVMNFSAICILTFCKNHHLLQLFGRPQWLTVKGRSETYVEKIVAQLKEMGTELRLNCAVDNITSTTEGIHVVDVEGTNSVYDKCIIGAHAPDALQMLGDEATYDERCILGAFQYSYSDIYLHRDTQFLPKHAAAWSAWNFLGSQEGRVCVTYWLNLLQNLKSTGKPFLVTLNPTKKPLSVISKWQTGHPIPSPAAVRALQQLDQIQGKRGIWFCGAYQGYGFHEDGLKAGLRVAKNLVLEGYNPLQNYRQMVFSWLETGAQYFVLSFLRSFVSLGRIQLFEDGGTIVDIDGNDKGSNLNCKLRIHNPSFFWKIATRVDLGLAEAYMDGDFTFVDEKHGLLDFLMLLIRNRDLKRFSTKIRGWWTPVLFTATLASGIYYFKHALRKNTINSARRNISKHYDLSNDLFALFLDETMTYSCGIFKGPDESLKDAQLRKIHHLIDKAKITSTHEVLEIGFGWGSMALEVVRHTGCKYTGISLSREQLEFAQERVNKAGLEDKITLKLCDYRTINEHHKYDRIISCEMLEAVGHEYYKEFFSKCDYLLAPNGLMVVQVITIPDERYDEYRRSSDFVKEYIFPGGCLPSLSILTKAMANGSSLCVEHLENIGIHYFQTLLCWRDKFLSNKSTIKELGFDERFIKMWEYYLVYCAAGFKTCTLGTLQIVFSRSGNLEALGSPYMTFPSLSAIL